MSVKYPDSKKLKYPHLTICNEVAFKSKILNIPEATNDELLNATFSFEETFSQANQTNWKMKSEVRKYGLQSRIGPFSVEIMLESLCDLSLAKPKK